MARAVGAQAVCSQPPGHADHPKPDRTRTPYCMHFQPGTATSKRVAKRGRDERSRPFAEGTRQ
jgi:hypothetical protein